MSYFVDEDYPARPDIQQPLPEWSNCHHSESSTLETDVYVWCYTLLVLRATIEEKDWTAVVTLLSTYHLCISCQWMFISALTVQHCAMAVLLIVDVLTSCQCVLVVAKCQWVDVQLVILMFYHYSCCSCTLDICERRCIHMAISKFHFVRLFISACVKQLIIRNLLNAVEM